MKILIVVDKEGTAIDRLAKSVRDNLKHHQIVVLPVHPKRSSFDELFEAQKLMEWADIIDVHYWKSGAVLRENFEKSFLAKPRILFHFNPYDVQSEENKHYDTVVVGNEEMHNKVPSAHLIQYSVDLDFFKFNQEYTQEKTVMMSVNRIEGKKGVLEVAQACKDLGYKFILVGRVSKGEYMEAVKAVGADMEFLEGVSDEELLKQYSRAAIHVCNSVDNYESGTLPILESMAVGVPVLTRMVGHVPDIFNNQNMIVRIGQPEDLEDLKHHLKDLMENRDLRINIRDKAWETIKNMDNRRMALEVQKLYYRLNKPMSKLVSIIIPTRDHLDSFMNCLIGACEQDYDNFEIVVADSGEESVELIIKEVKKLFPDVPMKYIRFKANGYSLPEGRNRAIIEADGKILVFCDDRMQMKKDAVKLFASYCRPKAWVWGMKDKVVKGFVENFSAVYRDELIKHGMFNERIQSYGGMTQEIRERFEEKNNFDLLFLQEAEAMPIKRATSKAQRREDIVEAKFTVYKLYQK